MTLRVTETSLESSSNMYTSIFGVDPTKSIINTSSAFDCWKGWKKVSARFFRNSHNLVHAPYFLRAARIWKTILDWCDDEERSRDVGKRLRKSSYSTRGLFYSDWHETIRSRDSLKACQAFYAFSGGETSLMLDSETLFDGMFGSYSAYGYYSCTRLHPPQYIKTRNWGNCILVAGCLLSMKQGMEKCFCIDIETGTLFLRSHTSIRVVAKKSQEPDEFLLWLEEYADRLDSGKIGVGPIDVELRGRNAITLYPRFPSNSPPIVTEGVPPVSRAVTRGIEVIASAVYVPQGGTRIGFIYSIRVRLMTPDDDDYVSPSDRGFETCQLVSRHWRITNDSTGQIDRVDGQGVIGMHPILREGGYTEAGEDFEGTFQYQSCTGNIKKGSFGGHMKFVPETLKTLAGPSFDVELRPFVLDNQPAFLY
eukprot:CAMPEP_0172506386 /NCGR_PEP_ID=MMETSP1066-20121228/194636_1 /TAXON_ID=671091 /ORGANISM="Coscinodiscus wailesii, Strain CCMP2513" /LENGTH=421 /DNA_ID=CAMNT_0013283401 /DNA_START=325 /DNA_END=1590 /DNA_ORIENTATION=+